MHWNGQLTGGDGIFLGPGQGFQELAKKMDWGRILRVNEGLVSVARHQGPAIRLSSRTVKIRYNLILKED